MKTLSQTLRELTVNGKVNLADVLKFAEKIDQERSESLRLLSLCKTQVGTHIGEQIESQIATMNGAKFNPAVYHYDRLPAGQE